MASFTWFGVYWATSQPARGGLGQRQPARLTDAHRRAHVDLEEDVLDRDRVRPELVDERRQLALRAPPTVPAAGPPAASG